MLDDANSIGYLRALDYYYIGTKSRKVFAIFAAILYFILTVLIFVLLRYMYMGTVKDLYLVDIFALSFNNIINILIVVTSINYYFRIIDHIYLRSFERYATFAENMRDNPYYFMFLRHFLKNDLYVFFRNLTFNNKAFIKYYRNSARLEKEWGEDNSYYKKQYRRKIIKYRRIKRFREYIHKARLGWLFNFIFHKILNTRKYLNISLFSGSFLEQMPVIIVIITLLYEIHIGTLFYTYYILFFYVITRFVGKFRKFLNLKDVVNDEVLSDYFYRNDNIYPDLIRFLYFLKDKDSQEEYNFFRTLSEQSKKVLLHQDEIVRYLLKDFLVWYRLEELYIKDKITYRQVKYLNILLLCLIGNIYLMYHYTKYTLLLGSIITISPIWVTIPLLYISWLSYMHTYADINPDASLNEPAILVEDKKYITIFWLAVLMQGILILFLIMANKLTLLPTESMLNWGWLCIYENFSQEEKIIYIFKHMRVIAGLLPPNNEYWLEIFRYIDMTSFIHVEDMSLEDIREEIKRLAREYLERQATKINQEKTHWYLYVKNTIKIIIKWLFKN
jgi:hypothetical protein